MGKFIVEPHFRLQEWVAEEKGYFRDQGLDYEFRELIRSSEGQHHNKGGKGAFQSIEQGREANVSCACHWTVNVAASSGHTKLYADLYSVAPSGIFVAADSKVRTPADLAGVPISVGFQSGSHYSTIQALEQYIAPSEINLIFEDGMLFSRMERFIDGKSPAAALFNGPYYLAEQLGFRKIIDTTFMIAAMIKGSRTRKIFAATSARCARRNATSTCAPNSTRITTRTNSPTASMP
jgi:ABC-type nitrate/sulfonate/bicarbonate transport system substrate-binding protein